MLIYCVVGIECNIYNIPIKMSILGSFTESEKAIEFRNKQKQYTTVDIVETYVNDVKENIKFEYQMEL